MTTVEIGALADVGGASPNLRAYLARPGTPGPHAGVVVLHESFGLDDVICRHADRLAAAGYLALAPDLYSDGGARRCLVPTFRALLSGHGRAFADIEASRHWLVADPTCSGRVGVIGFCLGGGFALLAAGRGFDAAAVNYGRLPADLDAAVHDACPIVASYGGRDRSLRHAAPRLEAALHRAGVPHDVREYPTAGHSFLNDALTGPAALRPVARILMGPVGPEPRSADDAWRRIEDFFARHLGGGVEPADSPGGGR